MRVSSESMSFFRGQPLREDLVAQLEGELPADFTTWKFRLEVLQPGDTNWTSVGDDVNPTSDGLVVIGRGEMFLNPAVQARIVTDQVPGMSVMFRLG